MIHPYDATYLLSIQEIFSDLLDFLFYYEKLNYKDIENILCKSKYVRFLLEGNPHYAVGKSSVEIMNLIKEEFDLRESNEIYADTFEKSPQYWAGYALSYYCYEKFKDFKYIFSSVKFEKIIYMYKAYHEMDISRFVEELDNLLIKRHKETNLKL